MKKIFIIVGILFSLLSNDIAFGETHLPKLFLFLGGHSDIKGYKQILSNPYVTGVQIIYPWKMLEPQKGIYDFSAIETDLSFLNALHKKLFIQIQDRSFEPNIINVPDYLREEKNYKGGVSIQLDISGENKPTVEGWVAKVWEPQVRNRFQQLIKTLAAHFDGRIYGINLPETSIDLDVKQLPQNFTSDKYFEGELENVLVAREVFHKSIVIQYVNFFPNEWNNDHHYMSRFFSYAIQHHIGLGGPDVIPFKKGQMQNSYPFFHENKEKIVVIGMAIQSPDYSYKNPATYQNYSFDELYSFAKEYLGAGIIFWDIQEPFFSKELKPHLNSKYFEQEHNT